MKIAGLFPGQGSQQVGMGGEFFRSNDTAQQLFSVADRALGFPLSKLCLEGPIETLTLTQNAQPAILTVSYICFSLANIPLAAAAGHSLGEYSALVAAGSLEFADAVQLVHKRGRYMQEAVKPGAGKMVAVMGPSEDEILAAIKTANTGVAEIANLNSPGQIVVAGDAAGIDAFSAEIQKAGGKVIPLQVSAPFHCSLMKPAAEALAKDLDAINIRDPKFPVYANFTAKTATTASAIRQCLKDQVCGSVRWTASMENLIREQAITHTVEFGPGGVLTKLLKRINKEPERFEIHDSASLAATRDKIGQ